MRIHFDVDSRLLRELGARLVGQPHIALAELIKNAYDADATHVVIRIRRRSMTIVDNGHGMTLDEFRNRWMRIGTAQKETEKYSRVLKRPLTGSKGVGRLAVQLLANELRLETVSRDAPETSLVANVNWGDAVDAGLLTRASAEVEHGPVGSDSTGFAQGSAHGTRITLTDLQQTWTTRTLRDLAREIWPLRPPFAADAEREAAKAFTVVLDTGNEAQEQEFKSQMEAVLGLWTARLVGKMLPANGATPKDVVDIRRPQDRSDAPLARDPGGGDGTEHPAGAADDAVPDAPLDEDDDRHNASDLLMPAPRDAPGQPRVVKLSLQFEDGSRELVHYRLPDCGLDKLRFEIRVFKLQNRQPAGITVGQARGYLKKFGGVHVYDAGFHLPYYGPDTDWLHVEMDHSHRLSRSALLPEDLLKGNDAVAPMQYLPTNSRLFGAVHVDTGHELPHARTVGPAAVREALYIQVTRDRLSNTHAYRSLVQLTRFAIDLYAIREAQRAWAKRFSDLYRQDTIEPAESGRAGDPSPDETGNLDIADRAARLHELVEHSASAIPEATLQVLREEIAAVADRARREREIAEGRVGLLGALATAGITALAQEHEAAKQNALLAQLVRRLRSPSLTQDDVGRIADQIDEVLRRAAATRRLFSYLLDARTRDSRGTFLAAPLVAEVIEQVRPLSRGVSLSSDGVPPSLRLPDGGYAEWSALLQNVLLNAVNATLDSPVRRIDIDGGVDGPSAWLRIQDTGSGVDLATAERLFLPFERRQAISAERAALGLGGTGLGLTIVRMIAVGLGALVTFEPPDDQHSTALTIRWRTT